MSENKKTMRVVAAGPGKKALITEIENTLKGMQDIVGGDIEVIRPFEDSDVCLVCNGEGKLLSLAYNRKVTFEGAEPAVTDIIAGDFFICRRQGGNLVGLTVEQAEKYQAKFLMPEYFFNVNRRHVLSVPAHTEYVPRETEPSIRAKDLIEAFKPLQMRGFSFGCFRCGRASMRPDLSYNALSRHADVYICPECGMEEAMLDTTGKMLPLEQWAICKELVDQTDNKINFTKD